MDASTLTSDEKTLLLAGSDFWHSGAIPGKVEALRMSDGPHGLRKQRPGAFSGDMEDSYPATCFPTASALGCSFDEELLQEVGAALGQECRDSDVDILLGPGANMKRDPRCGRNFEYFSEDPYLSGKLAAAYIRGVQSKGVGTSLKHFATNSQERKRMEADSVVDERTLREIYLTAFEIAVREGRPWTLMTAYNRLNGTYCAQNKALLDIARCEWGFDGAVVSDWGGMSRSVPSVAAGLSLSMPGPQPDHIVHVRQALAGGMLAEAQLDAAVQPLLDVCEKAATGRKAHPTTPENERAAVQSAHQALAKRAARSSAVLLRNDGMLPLDAHADIAVIGAFAEYPRYQGGGSSHVNPYRLDTPLDALRHRFPHLAYAPGYDARTGRSTTELATEAARTAKDAGTVVLFLGQAEDSESEGYDRLDFALPDSQVEMLKAVCAVNPNTVAVLQCGAPVDTSWRTRVRALLLASFGGCACGPALADLLTGYANPSGKLAETWPERLADTPCGEHGFPDNADSVRYRESLYIGYRWYDAAAIPPAFPFGHGLSYTRFSYGDLRVRQTDEGMRACIALTNIGDRAGAEAVQLYVAPGDTGEHGIFKAPQQLKGFRKVCLEPGESAELQFDLDSRAFAYYDVNDAAWTVEAGTYEIRIGSSSRDIRARAVVEMPGKEPQRMDAALSCYGHPAPGAFSDAAFEKLLGHPLPQAMRPKRPFTADSPVSDLGESRLGRFALRIIRSVGARLAGGGDADAMLDHMLQEVPLRAAVLEGTVDMSRIEALVRLLNHEGGVIAALRRNYGKQLKHESEEPQR